MQLTVAYQAWHSFNLYGKCIVVMFYFSDLQDYGAYQKDWQFVRMSQALGENKK